MTVTFHLINSSLWEEQRQATEDDHQNKSDQGHLLNLTKANPAIDKHNRRGDDQRRSSRIDVINLVKREKRQPAVKKSRNCFILRFRNQMLKVIGESTYTGGTDR
ncbi:Uncharacterised protein [Escherichia coli]|uniref:Uncharacterized protein n=1 Tax=Escherichia coli TaxID=562 RepID=A0A377DT77_ECOLX|nr:Uncharacterised protein [Escherichia coli]